MVPNWPDFPFCLPEQILQIGRCSIPRGRLLGLSRKVGKKVGHS